jgi:SAM-dependent methyltransferase
MQHSTNVKNWISCWNAWKESNKMLTELGSAELWNKRWKKRTDSFAKMLDPQKKQNPVKDIFRLLDEAGFHAKDARVLDIGCGPGTLSLPLARAGAQVTSLDISSSALDYIKENTDREGLSIETVECSWWTTDIDKLGFRNKFDLVIGSMTPSIKDVQTFDRMVACSRKYCYYSGGLPGGRDRIHQEIYKNILKTDSPRRSNDRSWFLYHFMYLYLNGYRPLVRIHHMHHKMEVDWEEAADRAIKSIDDAVICTETTKKKIRDYYKKSAVDGKYHTRSGGYTGMMVWDVNL